ncbi:cytochrome c-type biogenesis protein [Acetobacter senegalensis]|uniref:cytochrome c-type biogenesis protein n=1 Tax=Acetobacter senegalensis TaxID=446692 RepID=UPI00264BD00A|nr:cytochrome c-type biogenesis protein [Acetobacter senegalensis]MDN7351247.1 cytochrome c-type biogenesis protein CcmH [Acetobacter senegalensis]
MNRPRLTSLRRLVPAFLIGLSVLLAPALVMAVDDPSEMLPDPKQESRAEAIGSQLRCLVCQNESIEDSSAGLARDLRRVVREHVAKGETNKQIMDWMVDRYGNFIRLSPPLSVGTLLLWSMPVLALLLGLTLAFFAYRRRAAAPAAPLPLSDDEKARLAKLTKD